MAHQQVVRVFDLFAEQSFALMKRNEADKSTAFNQRGVDLFRSRFVEPIAIAGSDDSWPTCREMLLQMVSRKDTVAIGKKQVRCAARSHAVVSATCDPETIVRVTNPTNGKGSIAREIADYLLRVVHRPVVGDDNFEFPGDSPLAGQRQQRSFQVLGTLVRRENHRYFKLWRHEI